MDDAFLQFVNDVLAKSYPGLMGVKITEISEAKTVIKTEITPKHLNPSGVMHGGAIVTLADTVASIATLAAYGVDSVSTTNLNVSYLKSVSSGKVTAVAVPLKKGKTLAVWDVKCYDDAGDVLAYVTVTFIPMKKVPNGD